VLNLALNFINYFYGKLAFTLSYILLEIAVFAIEAAVYMARLGKINSKPKLVAYACIANLASFALGMALANWIPAIF